MYEALSSHLSLAHSRISTGLAGALNRLSLGPAADRRQSAQRVGLIQIALELCNSSRTKGPHAIMASNDAHGDTAALTANCGHSERLCTLAGRHC